ncbi:hypothetical protein IMZ48_13145 [Candidatus Bathyarchaeota archaeon]|nr:hypothetical protein [Candidatus Bathyarchaeota archaeon]
MAPQPARARAEPPSPPFSEAMRDRQARGKEPESDEFECVPPPHPCPPPLILVPPSSHSRPPTLSPSPPPPSKAIRSAEDRRKGHRANERRSDRDTFRAVEERRVAAQILSDPELLLMYALSRQDVCPSPFPSPFSSVPFLISPLVPKKTFTPRRTTSIRYLTRTQSVPGTRLHFTRILCGAEDSSSTRPKPQRR